MSLPGSFSSAKLTAMNTKRAYKERFYPTPEQALLLASCSIFTNSDAG